MQHSNRSTSLPWILAILSLLWINSAAHSDEITITRVGSTDWICADAQSVRISGHQRVDKAIQACANRSLADGKLYRVIPTQYKVLATRVDAPPADPPTDPPIGSVTLSWQVPTHNDDGTVLTDLAEYTIYFGPDAVDGYSSRVAIDNESLTTFVIDNLPADCYKFVMTASNDAGEESRHSGIARKGVNVECGAQSFLGETDT